MATLKVSNTGTFDIDRARKLLIKYGKVDKAAEEMGIHPNRLWEKFKKIDGKPPSYYITGGCSVGYDTFYIDLAAVEKIFDITGDLSYVARKIGIPAEFDYKDIDRDGDGSVTKEQVIIGSTRHHKYAVLISMRDMEKYSRLYGLYDVNDDPEWSRFVDRDNPFEKNESGVSLKIYPLIWWAGPNLGFFLEEMEASIKRRGRDYCKGSWGDDMIARRGRDIDFGLRRIGNKAYNIKEISISGRKEGLDDIENLMKLASNIGELSIL